MYSFAIQKNHWTMGAIVASAPRILYSTQVSDNLINHLNVRYLLATSKISLQLIKVKMYEY